MDPEVRQDLRVRQAKPAAELGAQAAQDIGVISAVSATTRMRSPGAAPVARDDRGERLRAQELRDRRVDLAVGPHADVDQALGAEAPGNLGQLVDLAAGRLALAGHDDCLDPAARSQGLVEDPESTRRPARVGQGRGQVDQLHAEAQVGLVGPEPLDDLGVGEARERHLLERSVRVRRRG